MKRLTVLFGLIAGLALLLAACGGKENGSSPPADRPASSQPASQQDAPAVEPVVGEPDEEIGVGTPGRVRLVEFYADW
jgi:predicted small lipoprotein YifL